MIPRKLLRGWVAFGSSLVLTAGLAAAAVAGVASATDTTTTTTTEAARLALVKVPKLEWFECAGAGFECATAKVPLDYNNPKGAQVELALTRARATEKNHIGSLFVNPGGPGGSAADFVIDADSWASPELRARFDIIGMDPRGIGYSDNVKCFSNLKAQVEANSKRPDVAFPITPSQDKKYASWAKTLGQACSATGKPLSASMSTAEVARDMELMRRAVGDAKLNYLGFSYGSYLGEVYANMFPDRFRTLAIDGIIEPAAWLGTTATKNLYPTERLKSAQAGSRAFFEILLRCDKAGGERCKFATGDPVKNFELVAARLKKKPLGEENPADGENFTFTYQDLISYIFSSLYDPFGSDLIAQTLSSLLILTEPPATNTKQQNAAKQRSAAVGVLVRNLAKVTSSKQTPKPFGFPYSNGDDAFFSVQCTDSAVGPASADAYTAYANAAEKRVKYFGRLLASQGLPCARNTWTAHDEDLYRGPFNRATTAPVLIVGNYWDPITSYNSAVGLEKTMPNSRLLRSDSWGHTAYGTSACATNAVDTYLISGKLPAKGTVCTGDVQPYAGITEQAASASSTVLVKAAAAKSRRGNTLTHP